MAKEGLTRWKSPLRLSDLSPAQEHSFEIAPSTEEMADLAKDLDLSALRKVRFKGTLTAVGKRDWRLDGVLGATVVQPCVATLVPVTTRVDTEVTRTYVADFEESFEPDSEVEMPEDDAVEPIPQFLKLSDVAEEALALNVPAYPRAEGAELGVTQFTQPGKAAMTDDDVKPFAGLKALRDKLEKGE